MNTTTLQPPDAPTESDSPPQQQGIDPQRIPRPEETEPIRILWEYVGVLSAIHLVVLLAFLPWTFAVVHVVRLSAGDPGTFCVRNDGRYDRISPLVDPPGIQLPKMV